MNTNKEYLKTLAQQEDLNWDGDPELDVEYECEEEHLTLAELAARLRDSEAIYVVKWFYD